jgi:hypothetical protein
MIPPSGTFEYEGEFTSESFSDSDVVVHGRSISRINHDRLVGHHPKLRFWNDRLVLVASGKSGSSLRNASFWIGDVVPVAARPGDWLYVVRTGSGGIGLSLLRDERLVLAIGAVAVVPLGTDVGAVRRSDNDGFDLRVRDCWLEFQVGSEHVEVRNRGLTELGGYQIYLEHCWDASIGGSDECVAMSAANNPAINLACLRSAVLLGNSQIKLTRWDGTETFG